MLKAAPSVLLAAIALVATGCQELPPQPPNADSVTKTYQSTVAETCSEKHVENLSPDTFNKLARAYDNDLDLNSRQRVDKLTSDSCAISGASQPGCYNTGFLSAIQNIGDMNHFAVYMCAHPNGA